jgi:hypothetical protein
MKKLLTVLVLGGAVLATVGLSSRVSAQPEARPPAAPSRSAEPTDTEFDARVEARQREVLARLLASRRTGARPAALAR